VSRFFPTDAATAPHAEYRRHARRIRSTFARAPRLRLRALAELASAHDQRRAEATRSTIPCLPAQPAATFAQLVRDRMDGPVLRYSHRTALVREAEQRGIGRFEANLIIAAVQHEAGERRATEPVSTTSRSWIRAAVAVVATQGAIVLALWSLIS
jgi:hypothetical protein